MKAAIKNQFIYAIALAAAALCLVPAAALAQIQVAVVDLGRVLDEAPQSQQLFETLQDEFGPRQRSLMAQQEELVERQQRLERDGAVMGQEERLNLERSIRDGHRDLERRQNEFIEDLNLRRNEAFNELQRYVVQQIQSYADRSNFDLVLGEGIIYARSSVDITPQIIQLLQEQHQNR